MENQRKQSTLLSLCYEYSGDDINLDEKDWHEAKHLVKIFDNYAIEFAEWYSSKDEYFEYGKTIKESLEMFKKEKGL
jgi:hypothetical protein